MPTASDFPSLGPSTSPTTAGIAAVDLEHEVDEEEPDDKWGNWDDELGRVSGNWADEEED
ncbi:MAG: hypothetical protein ACR2M9_00410 [Cyanophyceae cyanobacterium]